MSGSWKCSFWKPSLSSFRRRKGVSILGLAPATSWETSTRSSRSFHPSSHVSKCFCWVPSSTAPQSRQSIEGHVYLKYSVTWLILEDASGRGLWNSSLGTVLGRGQKDTAVAWHSGCSRGGQGRNMGLSWLSPLSLWFCSHRLSKEPGHSCCCECGWDCFVKRGNQSRMLFFVCSFVCLSI